MEELDVDDSVTGMSTTLFQLAERFCLSMAAIEVIMLEMLSNV